MQARRPLRHNCCEEAIAPDFGRMGSHELVHYTGKPYGEPYEQHWYLRNLKDLYHDWKFVEDGALRYAPTGRCGPPRFRRAGGISIRGRRCRADMVSARLRQAAYCQIARQALGPRPNPLRRPECVPLLSRSLSNHGSGDDPAGVLNRCSPPLNWRSWMSRPRRRLVSERKLRRVETGRQQQPPRASCRT